MTANWRFTACKTIDKKDLFFAVMGAIGTKLGLDVVAQGVETEAQRRMLAEMGTDKLQGFLFARPGAATGLPPASDW